MGLVARIKNAYIDKCWHLSPGYSPSFIHPSELIYAESNPSVQTHSSIIFSFFCQLSVSGSLQLVHVGVLLDYFGTFFYDSASNALTTNRRIKPKSTIEVFEQSRSQQGS